MKKLLSKSVFLCLIISFTCGLGVQMVYAQPSIPTAKQQIEAAVSAAPQAMRSEAKVYGYTQQGKWTTLRKGSNNLTCIADNPKKPKFHVACYFNALEPFMKRGRELRAKGMGHQKVDDMRRKEIKSGKLKWPRKPMGLYNLTGPKDGFNYKTGKVRKARPLYVVYIPFSTEKSTGITTSPIGPGAPWLMEAGLPWSHVMIPGRLEGTDVK